MHQEGMVLKRDELTRNAPMVRTAFKRAAHQPAKPPKPKKCKACRAPYQPDPQRPFVVWCSDSCAHDIALAKLGKVKAAAAKAERAKDKAKRDKLKTRRDYLADAQKSFNRYVRLRAIRFGHVCISSGLPLIVEGIGGGFDCGHFRSVGSAPHLRFNLNNAWGQRKQDNRYGAGAAIEYRRGLIALRGIEVVEALEANNEYRKFDSAYLIRLKKIFDKKAKRMDNRIMLS